MTTKRRGRKPGQKTAIRPVVDTVETRCPVCNSTERTPYKNANRVEGQGIAPDGRPYSEVILRPTVCLKCGQARIDRTYKYEPE